MAPTERKGLDAGRCDKHGLVLGAYEDTGFVCAACRDEEITKGAMPTTTRLRVLRAAS